MTLEAIRDTIAPELEALTRRIDDALGSSNPLMNSVVSGYLKSKGKMIRPILVILTAKLLGEVNDRVMAGAAAVELLHNASLIHDDVIDESKLRRGRPTVNSRWDNHIAVLVGDFFVSSSLQQALSTDDIRVVSSIANLGRLLARRDRPDIQRPLPLPRRSGLSRSDTPQDGVALRVVHRDRGLCRGRHGAAACADAPLCRAFRPLLPDKG